MIKWAGGETTRRVPTRTTTELPIPIRADPTGGGQRSISCTATINPLVLEGWRVGAFSSPCSLFILNLCAKRFSNLASPFQVMYKTV